MLTRFLIQNIINFTHIYIVQQSENLECTQMSSYI